MYISKLYIQNYKCFKEQVVLFQPGVNVIIGENNAGKTALFQALGLIFDRKNRQHIDRYEFYQGIDNFNEPPVITVRATLCSSADDTLDDKALVSTWLTKFESPWEAELTYQYYLPEEETANFHKSIQGNTVKEKFWKVVEYYIPKYVSRICGGSLIARLKAEPDSLDKFDYQFLDAIRDVKSELFYGSNPLFKSMLRQVLDQDTDDETTLAKRRADFEKLSEDLKKQLTDRLGFTGLLKFIDETGAKDGGTPTLGGKLSENDFISALMLFIENHGLSLPANYNGLGYNNLIYISLVLASLNYKVSKIQSGSNAINFPMLLIEEPEAHLHPTLQYKLLKYIQNRIKAPQNNRQIFITTHSTHVVAASTLDSIICMSLADDSTINISYPGKVFIEDEEGIKSKKYVERYLDATKSNMLFAKGIIFVEGIAEQLLVPCLAEYIKSPIENSQVAIVPVGGSTFKHFIPIFGACQEGKKKYAMKRRVACIIDSDPQQKMKAENGKRKVCYPYQINFKPDEYEYFPICGVVNNLKELCKDAQNISICYGTKTLEYDLAIANILPIVITSTCSCAQELENFLKDSKTTPKKLEELIDNEILEALEKIESEEEKKKARFATYYLSSIGKEKGEHAFDLLKQLRSNWEKPQKEKVEVTVPTYIDKAIKWACGMKIEEEKPCPPK